MLVTEGAFYGIIQDTWTSTLGFQVDRDDAEEFSAIGALTVCVKLTGAWDGEVRLHCSPSLARSIAAAIFQVEADKAGSDEILDALSELTHIIGGNLKALLPKPVTLSFPSLADPTDWAQTTPQWQIVCRLMLMSEGHPFVVSLLGDLPAAANAETPSGWESRLPTENP
ncbi:MAG: chemotaxis protein CheX [Terriglobia bacterium]|jgi:CheY-specific phosphatase CheX